MCNMYAVRTTYKVRTLCATSIPYNSPMTVPRWFFITLQLPVVRGSYTKYCGIYFIVVSTGFHVTLKDYHNTTLNNRNFDSHQLPI